MKIYILCGLLTAALCVPTILREEAPHELAGFVLGGRMDDFKDRVELDTVLPIRYFESMKEVEAKNIEGFKTGSVTYGTCIEPARIVRLKFKYADKSKRFFDELLGRYKKHLGKPDDWRGDPFYILIAWKWSFTDKDRNNISLILQHNTRDEEEKQGKAVKMTMWNLMLDEDRCFEQKHPQISAPPNFTFIKNDNKTFAIPATVPTIPVKPASPATTAMTRKTIVQYTTLITSFNSHQSVLVVILLSLLYMLT